MLDSKWQCTPLTHRYLLSFSSPALAALNINPKKADLPGGGSARGGEGEKVMVDCEHNG